MTVAPSHLSRRIARRVPILVVIHPLLICLRCALSQCTKARLPLRDGPYRLLAPTLFYGPDSLPAGKTFLMTIFPAQPLASQPLAAWFAAQAQIRPRSTRRADSPWQSSIDRMALC